MGDLTGRNILFFILLLSWLESDFFGLYQRICLIFLFLFCLLLWFFFVFLNFLKNYFFRIKCIIFSWHFFVQFFYCFRWQCCILLVLFNWCYYFCGCFSALRFWLLFRITCDSLSILTFWIRLLIYTPFICFIFHLFFIFFIVI